MTIQQPRIVGIQRLVQVCISISISVSISVSISTSVIIWGDTDRETNNIHPAAELWQPATPANTHQTIVTTANTNTILKITNNIDTNTIFIQILILFFRLPLQILIILLLPLQILILLFFNLPLQILILYFKY